MLESALLSRKQFMLYIKLYMVLLLILIHVNYCLTHFGIIMSHREASGIVVVVPPLI